jgi:streptomycin 6-kinase
MIDGINAIELISAVGFPAFVALWFMLRTEKIIKTNTSALLEIKEQMAYCNVRR